MTAVKENIMVTNYVDFYNKSLDKMTGYFLVLSGTEQFLNGFPLTSH